MQCSGKYNDSDTMPRSEFSLQLRGDDPSSPRLYAAAQYCSLPIIISDQQYTHATPFQCLVPYHLFSMQINESDFLVRGAETLREVSDTLTLPIRRRMRELLAHFRKDLLWQLPGNRVPENILLDTVRGRGADKGSTQRGGCCLFGDALNAHARNSFYPTIRCNTTDLPCPEDINVTDSREDIYGAAPC